MKLKERIEPTGYKNRIMMVGINPGQRQMKIQNIWLTDYGRFLKDVLASVGLDITDVWMTNLYKWKTPNNRQLSDGEKEFGFMELKSEIINVNPKIIVLMGNVVHEEVGPYLEAVNRIHFKVSHPSYARRFWTLCGRTYTNQFKKIAKTYGK